MRLRNVKGAREKISNNVSVINNPREYKGKWSEVFGNDNPIYIEIGMGKGRFIIDNAIQNPNKVDGSGRDAIIYSYAPSLTSEEVTNEYNKLATELRHKEAELNKMKAEIDDAITKDKIAKNVAYETKCEAYRQDLKAFREKMNDWKIKATDEANKLKIYLPDGPKQTYDKINKGEF